MKLDSSSRTSLLEELRQAGAQIKGDGTEIKCPFHDDEHPSGSVYCGEDGSWRFKCHAVSCGFCGDVFDVLSQSSGKPLGDVLREYKPDDISSLRAGRNAPAPRIFESIDAICSMVPGEIEATYTYTNPATQQPDLAVIRYRAEGRKSFWQVSPRPDGWVLKRPEGLLPLYNRIAMQSAAVVLVVEGEKCVHALRGCGFVGTTSPMGAGKASYADWSPLAGKAAVLWPDNDEGGIKHMEQVKEILSHLEPPAKVYWVDPTTLNLPVKGDVVDFIAGMIPEVAANAAAAVMDMAMPTGAAGKLKTRLDDAIAGRRRPVGFPWPVLTEISRALVQNTVTLLCGSPGATKSFLLLECLTHWHEQGIPVACYCLEDGMDYHLNRVLAQREGKANLTREEWQETHPEETRAAYWRHEAFLDSFGRRLWAAPDKTPTKADIAQWVEDRAGEGCRVVAVDPISAAEETRDVYVADSEFVNAIKRTARNHPISILLIMHPRKGHGSGAGTLDDLSGGASYQRLAHSALWLEFHKPPVTKLVSFSAGRMEVEFNRTLHILKSRNAVGANLGLAFGFDGATLRTSEYGVILKREKK